MKVYIYYLEINGFGILIFLFFFKYKIINSNIL